MQLKISLVDWNNLIENILNRYDIYAPIEKYDSVEFQKINEDKIENIEYNRNRTVSPLKIFFLPTRENVVKDKKIPKKRLIIGAPNCDIMALNLLDKIYLDEDFEDDIYKQNRKNTLIIAHDCYEPDELCHCLVNNVKPYPENNHDIGISIIDNSVYLNIESSKGKDFVKDIDKTIKINELTSNDKDKIEQKRKTAISTITKNFPKSYTPKEIKQIILNADDEIWKKYASDCVSCGACSAVCPTCHCFLLIDKKGFEKIRSWDTCQYPGFERVAAGEDPLLQLYERFKNRYLCKYAYKPDMYDAIACTGCGRCIEACIGKIDKNELIMEADKKQ